VGGPGIFQMTDGDAIFLPSVIGIFDLPGKCIYLPELEMFHGFHQMTFTRTQISELWGKMYFHSERVNVFPGGSGILQASAKKRVYMRSPANLLPS